MENEFLELIRTFEKSATRLEKLDTTIIGFKDIVEDLRGNLDELVEMVQLEQIVELAELSHLKLKQLEQQLEVYEQATNRLENQVDVFAKLVKGETETIDELYLYQIDEGTQEVKVIQKGHMGQGSVIQGLKVQKVCSYQNTSFALDIDGTILYVLNGENAVPILKESIEDFVVYQYQVYALVEGGLIQYHLLTQEKTKILDNIEKIRLLEDGKHLLCHSGNQEVTFIKL